MEISLQRVLYYFSYLCEDTIYRHQIKLNVKDRISYFPGLNGLRAIAALVVIVWHADIFIVSFSLADFGLKQSGLAGYAVNLFFVLSGFLITYLLMVEKEKTGTIDVKKFYMRRVLRIWPLYYVSILISFNVFQCNKSARKF